MRVASTTAMKLDSRYVEKPWGRSVLPAMFEPAGGRRIGEVWFIGDSGLPLLAKYLFTNENLSVQVHPDDGQAASRGLARGKSECWYIVDSEPGARIGLGLRRAVSAEELRAAALDGSIIDLLDWRPVAAGDFYYVPAGTIHAIGGGISLLEFQQNSDITYRLYDYGRSRELHLDDAVAVARRSSYDESLARRLGKGEKTVLVQGPPFTLILDDADALTDRQRWILPLEGTVGSGPETAVAGECLLLQPGDVLEADNARLLVGAAS